MVAKWQVLMQRRWGGKELLVQISLEISEVDKILKNSKGGGVDRGCLVINNFCTQGI